MNNIAIQSFVHLKSLQLSRPIHQVHSYERRGVHNANNYVLTQYVEEN